MRRRMLIRMTVPLLLVVAIVVSVAAWLWSRSGHHGPTGAPRAAYSGTLTMVQAGGWGTGDAWSGFWDGVNWAGLVDYGPDGNLFPELAVQVPSVANGGITLVGGDEVVTYRIKPGLRWSDGSPITSADYMAAYLVGSAPEADVFHNNGDSCPLRRATLVGESLIVTLRGVYPEALADCNISPFPWEYLQRKYGITLPAGLAVAFDAGQAQARYAGHAYQGSPLRRLIAKLQSDSYTSPRDLFNGPYKSASWALNGTAVLVPNPYYTALPPDAHHPRPARIRLLTPSGTRNTFMQAVLAGSLPAGTDMVMVYDAVPPSPPRSFRDYPPYHFDLWPDGNLEGLTLNQDSPALRDRRVRQALLYAIDKTAYLRAVFHFTAAQAALLAQTSPVPRISVSPYAINPPLPVNLYNPAKARALIAAAGYATSPTGPGRHLHLDLYTTPQPYRERGDVILQRMWRKVGIDVRPHYGSGFTIGGLYSSYAGAGILQRGHYDIAEFNLPTPRDPTFRYYSIYDPGQIPDQNHPNGANIGRVRDRTLFSFLDQAQHTIDEARRRQLLDQFQRYLVDQVYWIGLYSHMDFAWVKPTFGNYNSRGGSGLYFSWNAYQWYVR